MNKLKDYITRNHPKPETEGSVYAANKAWAQIENVKKRKQRWWLSLGSALAGFAFVVILSQNAQHQELSGEYSEETFILENFEDVELSFEETNQEYAFGF